MPVEPHVLHRAQPASMSSVDRLRQSAANLRTYGPDIGHWTRVDFLADTLQTIATELEELTRRENLFGWFPVTLPDGFDADTVAVPDEPLPVLLHFDAFKMVASVRLRRENGALLGRLDDEVSAAVQQKDGVSKLVAVSFIRPMNQGTPTVPIQRLDFKTLPPETHAFVGPAGYTFCYHPGSAHHTMFFCGRPPEQHQP